MAQTLWTILALIRWADERFKKEGMATPRLDAEVLLAEALGMDRVGLYTHYDQPLRGDELARFKQLVLRRLRREPVAYILARRREFWSLPLRIIPDVLIPRPETETLVELALTRLPIDRNINGRKHDLARRHRALSAGISRQGTFWELPYFTPC